MARKNYLFTSESVSEGHPDKVCDRISDEVVDLFYREALEQGMDPSAVRVACDETPELMPAPIYYAHRILKVLSDARHSGKEKALGPDSKSQVTVAYKNGKPVAATQIVVSHQHTDESMTSKDVLKLVKPYV